MQSPLSYRHRVITDDDLVFIRKLIAEHPGSSRWALSKKLCEAWNWVQANGALRDMVCRGMMLMLHRQGLIELPSARPIPIEFGRRRRPLLVSVDEAALQVSFAELGPLEMRQVRRTPEEALFNSLLAQHHYLGYAQPVGEHLKYLVYAQGRPVACVAWSSAPRHLGSPRPVHWLGQASAAEEHPPAGLQHQVFGFALGAGSASGLAHSRAHGANALSRLATHLRAPDLLRRDLHRSAALSGNVLPGGQLDGAGGDDGARQGRTNAPGQPFDQGSAGLSAGQGLPPATLAGERMKRPALVMATCRCMLVGFNPSAERRAGACCADLAYLHAFRIAWIDEAAAHPSSLAQPPPTG
jgi:hypothetical protein